MMKHDNKNGPAFPNPALANENFYGFDGCEGMTLRDYAAIHADLSSVEFKNTNVMASFMGEPAPEPSDINAVLELSLRVVARIRYMQADAMMREREGGDA